MHQAKSSQIKVRTKGNMKTATPITADVGSPLRPSRPLRETNFTHPHQTGPKRSKPHPFADNFQRSCRDHEAVRCQIPRPGSCRGHEAGQSASSQIKPNQGSKLFSADQPVPGTAQFQHSKIPPFQFSRNCTISAPKTAPCLHQGGSSQIKPGGGRLIGSQLFSRILTVSHERCTNSHRFSLFLTKSHYFSLPF